MRINEIRKKEVNVMLNADELVLLGNALYFYEKHHSIDKDCGRPGQTFHELNAQIVTARDLCQYGHLDSHSLGCIMRHKVAASPDGGFAKSLREYLEDSKEIVDGDEGIIPEKPYPIPEA